MSDALEATVQVRLRLKDGHNTAGIGGEITARIDGFEDKYRSVLFRCAEERRPCFSLTDDDSWFLLELARNVVAVPCGKVLHIDVGLQVVTEDGKEVEMKVPLSFDNNGICSSQRKTDDGKEVEVEVTWYPEVNIKEINSRALAAAPNIEDINILLIHCRSHNQVTHRSKEPVKRVVMRKNLLLRQRKVVPRR
jgi:hypothetical protein